MAYNRNLLNLSRETLEPYVINFLQRREKVDHVEMSSIGEDTHKKIDVKVFTKEGEMVPVQIKTRVTESVNFSLPNKDIIEEQENRVFCFIDKTFTTDVVNELLSLNEMAMNAINDEAPRILMLTQKQFLKDKSKFKFYKTKDGGFYLIPIDYLDKLVYN